MSINPTKFTSFLASCVQGKEEDRPPFDDEVRDVDSRTRQAALTALGSHWRWKPLQEVSTKHGVDFQTGEKINHDYKN